MNRPSCMGERPDGDGHMQSPNARCNGLTTSEDLDDISYARELKSDEVHPIPNSGENAAEVRLSDIRNSVKACAAVLPPVDDGNVSRTLSSLQIFDQIATEDVAHGHKSNRLWITSTVRRARHGLVSFSKFIGPGFMVAVAYIDPGNYATDIAAGATYRFRLLFIVLLSNIFAIFLQSLSIKLGTVSGLNLAEACRAFLPRWLNYFLYVMAEGAIIATDIAEVIGTAIALNLLVPQIPLVAGCAISIFDVMVILFFYQPSGSMRGLRAFEFFVIVLVLAVAVCFCIQLSLIHNSSVGDVFRGYLPSSALLEQTGLYQACGILGATVMPHSLYLGSGIVQSRLREFDARSGLLPEREPLQSSASSTNEVETGVANHVDAKTNYVPSLGAIRFSLKYSIAELTIALFTFALFVNSAILIVAGASLFEQPDAINADIFGIHYLLSTSIAPAAGTVFALALLLSGVSAGIVCTIAGQMVSEGQLNLKLKPWVRRLVTRSISITPSIIIAGAVGRQGLDKALNGTQVALSIVLPFVTAPLIYFTSLHKFMTVQPGMARFGFQSVSNEMDAGRRNPSHGETAVDYTPSLWSKLVLWRRRPVNTGDAASVGVKMANSWAVVAFAALVWLIITALNIANLILLGRGD